MGKQYGLDMVSILRQTWKRTLDDFYNQVGLLQMDIDFIFTRLLGIYDSQTTKRNLVS